MAEISEYVILGMDLLQKYNIKLDLGNKIMRIENEELDLSARHANDGNYRILVSEISYYPLKQKLSGVIPELLTNLKGHCDGDCCCGNVDHDLWNEKST